MWRRLFSESRKKRRAGMGIGLAVVLLLALVGVFSSLNGWPGYPSPSRSADSRLDLHATALARIEEQLARERDAKRELERRLIELESRMARLRAGSGNIDSEHSLASELDVEPNDADEAQSLEIARTDASRFDKEALRALGLDPIDIERLRERWVSRALETVALSHQALREGRFQQDQHRAEMIEAETALREELGDTDYDRYLYALGQPNRVRAGEVLEGSSANEAGLQRGDLILSYNDIKIFKPDGLLLASSGVDAGRSVPMKILRDGRQRTLYLESGPLGILLERSREMPSAP